DPAEHLLPALAGGQRRHLQVARKEALVIQPERRDALVEQIEVACDQDGHRRKVVYIRRAWIPSPRALPPWTASSRAPPGERWLAGTDEPARRRPSARRPTGGARRVPGGTTRPSRFWPSPRRAARRVSRRSNTTSWPGHAGGAAST